MIYLNVFGEVGNGGNFISMGVIVGVVVGGIVFFFIVFVFVFYYFCVYKLKK